ncbi:MAG: 4-hydroxy-tetrahydrodipicolinate synthase [Actinomycetota bacterium]|nr:4-hydroxy-tetrahydrodipicolinate synthase [Actinomycetota bacterium]
MGGRFGDLVTAMVTPFNAAGEVDLKVARELASWLIDQGSQGLVVTGSTGEAATLGDEEKVALWDAVKEEVGDRCSVVAGTGTYDTAHSIHLTQAAERVGVDGALVVTPYYNRPPQPGLIAHFTAIAEATSLPLLLYDIPIRSGIKIQHSTLMHLAGVENIVGVKDAAGDAQAAARVIAEAPEGFEVYAGNDGETLAWIAMGAVGVVSVASHVVGPRIARMIEVFKNGNAAEAQRINVELVPVVEAMFITTNPVPVKAALRIMGLPVGEARLPLPPATDSEQEKLREALTSAGVI